MRITLTLAATLALAAAPLAAQGVNPADPNSASGGVLAQGTMPPGTAIPGAMAPGTMSQGAVSQGTVSQGTVSQGGRTDGTATPRATPAALPRLDEARIREELRTRGYTDLEGMARDGEGFRVREARRWGERVENLAVDAATGDVTNAQPMDERQIRAMLRTIGWSNLRDYRSEGRYVSVRGERNGRDQELRIDPRVGILDQPGPGR